MIGYSIYDMCHVTDWLHVVEGFGEYKNVLWRQIVLTHHNIKDDLNLWSQYEFFFQLIID